jgi:hypothetical protein
VIPELEGWTGFGLGVEATSNEGCWFVLMGEISLKVATVGSGLGDCRVLRENLSNDLGKNLDNLLGDSFLEGGRENRSLAALRPFSSAK